MITTKEQENYVSYLLKEYGEEIAIKMQKWFKAHKKSRKTLTWRTVFAESDRIIETLRKKKSSPHKVFKIGVHPLIPKV